MKKTVATIALMASTSSAYALVAPGTGGTSGPRPAPRTVCLSVWEDEGGNQFVGSCDETDRNQMYSRELKENGCAEGQAAMQTLSVSVRSCPTFVQL